MIRKNSMLTLSITSFTRTNDTLSFLFTVDNLSFRTALKYDSVSFFELETRFSFEFMEHIYFHIAAFEINKLASLKPDVLELGPFSKFYTPEIETLWRTLFKNIWAEWRYKNQCPFYRGPKITAQFSKTSFEPCTRENLSLNPLLFCGGGKDSLVSMALLEQCSFQYDTLAYAHSIYGPFEKQHALINQLTQHFSPQNSHRMWVSDSFYDITTEFLFSKFQIKSLTAGETPSSLFASLPIALYHNHSHLILGHERSADKGNFIWDKTGEEVNHQWGKSSEAEHLINDYIQSHLIKDLHYFSILKPIYDTGIFSLLSHLPKGVEHTHSCNLIKPWCQKCAKCAYVWLMYMAYLPKDQVDAIFNKNLFDVPENMRWFKQLLGLDAHTPFECIGEVPEVRLAFKRCHEKGVSGKAMDLFIRDCSDSIQPEVLHEYFSVHTGLTNFPEPFRNHIIPLMKKIILQSKDRLFPSSNINPPLNHHMQQNTKHTE